MRLYNPTTGKFSTSRQLTRKLPGRPAAVYLYTEHAATTRILALDFDSTRGGPTAVQRDVEIARRWLTAAGGRLIIDRSTNGGMHIICPLAPATSEWRRTCAARSWPSTSRRSSKAAASTRPLTLTRPR